jgi:hypothetical protein
MGDSVEKNLQVFDIHGIWRIMIAWLGIFSKVAAQFLPLLPVDLVVCLV